MDCVQIYIRWIRVLEMVGNFDGIKVEEKVSSKFRMIFNIRGFLYIIYNWL